MHIVRLEAQNIQRLQAVKIEPSADASAIVLAGDNEAGKSSVLDSIEMALAGEKAAPPEPIRRGEETARVLVDLGDIIVTRRFTAKGSSLTVTNKEGLKYPSPQALLDSLYNKITFDPMAFANSKDQASILRDLVGLKTSDLDDKRKKEFDARTLVNRDVANAKGALEKAPHFPDAGEDLVDTAAVLEELGAADKLAEVAAAADRDHQAAVVYSRNAGKLIEQCRARVSAARTALEDAESSLKHAEQEAGSIDVDAAQRASFAAAAAVPDRAALRAKVTEAQAANQKVEANKRRKDLEAELARVQGVAAAHTKAIEAVDVEKAQRLADAKFPIEGLGLNDSGVTWQGLPFEQASTAIRTRVSVAIGMALHPKLKVLLVRNGNDLGAKNLQLLAESAREQGGQLWIERIAGGDGLQTVVIEDGAVKGAEPPEPATSVQDPPAEEPTPNSQLPSPDAPPLESGPAAETPAESPKAAEAPKQRARRKGGLAGLPLEEGSPK